MAAGHLGTVLRQLRQLAERSEGHWLGDAALLQRFVDKQDAAAFELLVWRHGCMVLNVCRRLLGQPADADDAFQATFLTLVRKARSIGKREAVASWLYKVAYRVALRARQQTAQRIDNRQDGVERLGFEPPQELAWRELRPVLDEEVNRLPMRYRVPFILCYLEGKTNAEAAAILGCPRGTIATHLSRARSVLRARLTRRGLTLGASLLGTLLGNEVLAAVPPALISATVHASLATASGVAGVVMSANAVALSQGVVHAMFLTKLKIAAVLVLTLSAVGTGTGFVTYEALAAVPGGTGVPAAVGQKPEPTKEEKLRQELELARKEALAQRDQALAIQAEARAVAEQARKQEQAELERQRALAAEAQARAAAVQARTELDKLRADLEALKNFNIDLQVAPQAPEAEREAWRKRMEAKGFLPAQKPAPAPAASAQDLHKRAEGYRDYASRSLAEYQMARNQLDHAFLELRGLELQRLQGTWTPATPIRSKMSETLVFDKNMVKVSGVEFFLDIAPPEHVNGLRFLATVDSQPGPGDAQFVFLYEITEEGRLRLCLMPDKRVEWPERFDAPDGSGRLILEFKREGGSNTGGDPFGGGKGAPSTPTGPPPGYPGGPASGPQPPGYPGGRGSGPPAAGPNTPATGTGTTDPTASDEPVVIMAKKHLKALHAARLKIELLATKKRGENLIEEATQALAATVSAAVEELVETASKPNAAEIPGFQKHLPKMQTTRAAWQFHTGERDRLRRLGPAAIQAEWAAANAQLTRSLNDWCSAVEDALQAIVDGKRGRFFPAKP